MLEIRHLYSLAAIAQHGKLSKAADSVHLTQSALSHQIRALEAHYAVALFERTSTGLHFTTAGERILDAAHEVIDVIAKMERDLVRLKGDLGGELRVALECHTCFDWLMPVLDKFRQHWPEVEVDLVAGFHSDPLKLLETHQAEVVIGSRAAKRRTLVSHPLFRFEILAVLPVDHPLRNKRYLQAQDFSDQTLITYPVPEDYIDVIREILQPQNIQPRRRTAELTVAILQLVASRRGIAALPNWGIKNYVDYNYIVARRIGKKGLWSDLYATMEKCSAEKPYLQDFVAIIQSQCFQNLSGIEKLVI